MNMQRFRQVLAYIEEHKREWDQRSCHSCFLFHAARMNGNTGIREHAGFGHDFLNISPGRDYDLWSWIISPDRTLDDFRTVARRPFA